MDALTRSKIVHLLDTHRIMTLATLRPDGWPQATTVGYVNEGLSIFFLCGADSQKAANLSRDDRVSLTINDDTSQIMAIMGLSMAAHAHPVIVPGEVTKFLHLLAQRYPEQPAMPALPDPQAVRVFRVIPTLISVLDYTKGFGHTDLAACQADDLLATR
ncbi:pyridoxamine 5'-phosphate oxidase family protein [Sphingomonas sp. MMS24-J13]|uniref:pyridoxamine 5'-phosphate oxidase family protein n=1 Tax=Sphingomonas sp. MMS24-J13 TaxID=3238686 RepID=UPI00384C7E43